MRAALIIVFLLFAGSASAQYFDKLFFVNWQFNTPLSNKDFAGRSSSKGARLGYRELIMDEKLAVGIDITWATYDDYVPRQTYVNGTSSLTTDFTNYANNYGALITADYYFRQEKKLMPYVGLGAGLAYNNYKRYYNVYSDGDNAFGLLLRPQAGAWFKFSEQKAWALNAAVYLDYSTAKSSFAGYGNFTNVGIAIGLVHLDW